MASLGSLPSAAVDDDALPRRAIADSEEAAPTPPVEYGRREMLANCEPTRRSAAASAGLRFAVAAAAATIRFRSALTKGEKARAKDGLLRHAAATASPARRTKPVGAMRPSGTRLRT